ncbi:MAG: hypothetical protein HYX34_04195 [Actinobacteria bacterium]|nr:hypothetical protein [Actinomycetota bacterium]
MPGITPAAGAVSPTRDAGAVAGPARIAASPAPLAAGPAHGSAPAGGEREGPTLGPLAAAATMGFGIWMLIGLFLDGWAHQTQRPDSFFTPWHAVIYSGFAGASAVGIGLVWRQHQPGRTWRAAVPQGHGLSLVGLAIFAVGGAGDLVWHQLFGVEVSVEALLSPTHLLLMVGGTLALTGPLRVAWQADDDARALRDVAGPVVGIALVTGLAMFFTMYASPFGTDAVRFGSARTDVHDFATVSRPAFEQLREMWVLGGILLTTVLVVVPVVLLRRRWRLPVGSYLVLLSALGIMEAALGDLRRPLLAVGFPLAGVVAEAMARRRAPVPATAAAIPAVIWLGYFAGVAVQYGIGWSAELWSGAVVLSALAGLVVSLLVDPRLADRSGRALA